jgi:hypothetical protein
MSEHIVESLRPRLDQISLFGDNPITYENTVWDDLKITSPLLTPRPSAPSFIYFKDLSRIPEFAVGNELGFQTQMPHKYKEGSEIHLHIHWTPHTRGVAENGSIINWRIDLSIANINEVFPSGSTYDLTSTCDGVNDKHQYQEASTVISIPTLTISHILIGKIYRAAGDTWITNTAGNRPALMEIDFHYQINTPGSKEAMTK